MNCKGKPDLSSVLGMPGKAPTAAQTAISDLRHMKMSGPGGVHALAFIGGCLLVSHQTRVCMTLHSPVHTRRDTHRLSRGARRCAARH